MSFRVLGCKIDISLWFFAMVALLLYFDQSGLILFGIAAVFIHEIGHLFFMVILNCMPKRIKFQPAGISIKRCGKITPYKYDLLIALGGCLFNFIAAVSGYMAYVLDPASEFAVIFTAVNISLALFNLIPISGLDGHDIIRLLLIRRFSAEKTERITLVFSVFFVLAVLVLGAFLAICNPGNISMLLSGVYLVILLVLNLRR